MRAPFDGQDCEPPVPGVGDGLELLRYVIKHDLAGLALFDDELRYLAASEGFLLEYGLLGENIIGRCHYDVFPDLPESWREVHRRALAGEVVRNEAERYERPDGSVAYSSWECRPWYAADGDIGGMVLYDQSTTAREEAMEALAQSERLYRQLFQLESDAIVLVDAESGRVLEANDAVCTLYGYTRAEWLTMRSTDVSLEPEETRDSAGDGSTWIPIRRHRTKDGSEILVEITASHFDLKGRHAVLAAMRDVTERERTAEALRESERRLRQAQKMEAIGRLAGGIAHDFNNLLTVIMGYAEMIVEGDCADLDQVQADVSQILQASGRAKQLTSQILAFSRRQPHRPEVVSPNALISGTEQLLRRTLGERVELVVSLAADADAVEVDPGQFSQIIMNLAANARAAMPAGGKLTVATTNVQVDGDSGRLCPGCPEGPYVMVEVRDTGHGMDEETLAHAFEPFFTTRGPGEGTGLGLSTVYGIVEQSRGHIFVESAPGAGSSFRVLLPAVSGAVEASPSERSRAAIDRQGTGRILLVEDQAAVRALAQRILDQAGYTVTAVATGDEALRLLQEGIGVDLLLTDVVLPGVTQGDVLAARAAEARPGLPVLLMSGYPRTASTTGDRLDPRFGFLSKPFTVQEFTEKVRAALAGGVPSA